MELSEYGVTLEPKELRDIIKGEMWSNSMIDLDSFGGRRGNIQWQNTWNELWGHTGFWEKNPREKGRFTLWGIRPRYKNTGEIK